MSQYQATNNNTIVTFSETVRDIIDEGTYSGEILHAETREFKSSYGNARNRMVASFKVLVVTPDGDAIELFYNPTLSQHPRSKFMETLNSFGIVPKANERLDLKAFCGMHVTVVIKHNEKDGVLYCNIDKMVKDDSAEEVEAQFILPDLTAEERESVDQLFEDNDTE